MKSSPSEFKFVSVVLPVINETHSLERVVNVLLENSDADIAEIIAIVCHKTTEESMNLCIGLKQRLGERFRIHSQKLPYLGGAIRDGFDCAKSDHILVMFSDAESDPDSVKDMIEQAKQHPQAIISASRWMKGGQFHGYGPIKIYYNYFAQKMFAWLYGSKLTDLTFGYRIYPATLSRSIRWQEVRHSFVFESILKPMRLGVQILELPTIWRARNEGESQLVLFTYLRYFWIGLKFRFYPRKKMWKT